MDRRDILLGTTTAAISLALSVQSQAQTKSLQDKLVGVWELVDLYDKGTDASQYYVWGEGVQGLAVYTSGGHFSTQIISANCGKATSKNPAHASRSVARLFWDVHRRRGYDDDQIQNRSVLVSRLGRYRANEQDRFADC